MTIAIITEDKIKTPGIQESVNYYQKLCSGWLTVSLGPVKDIFRTSRKRTDSHDQAIMSLLKPGDFLVVLDQRRTDNTGWEPDSQDFADFVSEIIRGSWHRVLFAIGGPDGFNQDLLNQAHRVLNLSALTFPHDLVPLILIEQIYRSLTILHRHPYHR